MNLIDSVFGAPDFRRLTMARLTSTASREARQRELYALLLAYYANHGLYDFLAQNRYEAGVKDEALKGLRTPAYRIVQFYASHLWPGDLDEAFEIEPDPTAASGIEEAIRQIWEWSNWASEKDVAAQHLPLYGDIFLRPAQAEDAEQVYIELVDPRHVSAFTEVRGFVKRIRLDVPQRRESSRILGLTEWRTHTEIWDKAAGLYRRWEHDHGLDVPEEDLGTPTEEVAFAELPVDFVPFVHAAFAPSPTPGDPWGVSAITPLLDRIDELNRKATRHAELMFNHLNVTGILTHGGLDSAGRPQPPLRVDPDADGIIQVGDARLLSLPGGGQFQWAVPPLDFDAYLRAIQADEQSLAGDAPEMIWSRLSESSDLSGKAIRTLLAPAVKRVERARSSAHRAFIRATQMALSLGQAAGLPGFDAGQIGTYAAGSFAHTYKKRDVLPLSEDEAAETLKARMEAVLAREEWLKAATPTVLREEGFSDEKIATIQAERAAGQQDAADVLLTAMQRGPRADPEEPPALPVSPPPRRATVREVVRDAAGRITRVVDREE